MVGLASSHSSSDSRTQYYRADFEDTMESYINNPELRQECGDNPKMAGSPFIDHDGKPSGTKSMLCVNAATGALTELRCQPQVRVPSFEVK